MRFAILSRHFPLPEGTASGRILLAYCQGLIGEGHQVAVSSWGPDPPLADLPAWCEWRRVDPAMRLGDRVRGLVRPRIDAVRAAWTAPGDAVAIADEPHSFMAMEHERDAVLTLHYLTRIDAPASDGWTLKAFQDHRAETRAVRRAPILLAYSHRLLDAVSRPATFIPCAIPIPLEPIPIVEAPVAALLADWRWPPNRISLRWLLDAWGDVRRRVPPAKLLLAGPGLDAHDVSGSEGVKALGFVPQAADVLSQAAVLAFPVPDTTGPKVKIAEALASGLPVVTTPAGIEGLVLPRDAGAVVAGRPGFASALAGLLQDAGRRAVISREGRAAMISSHAPRPAARARVRAIEAARGEQ